MYELRYMNAAESYFKKLKDKGLKLMFRNALERISVNPYEGEVQHGDLSARYETQKMIEDQNNGVRHQIY